MNETETALHFRRPKCAQAPIVQQYDKFDVAPRLLRGNAERHAVCQHRELHLKVDLIIRRPKGYASMRRIEAIRETLIHQWGSQRGTTFKSPRLGKNVVVCQKC